MNILWNKQCAQFMVTSYFRLYTLLVCILTINLRIDPNLKKDVKNHYSFTTSFHFEDAPTPFEDDSI